MPRRAWHACSNACCDACCGVCRWCGGICKDACARAWICVLAAVFVVAILVVGGWLLWDHYGDSIREALPPRP